MGEQLLQPADARGATDDPQMQADRQHARPVRALGIETVEGGDAVAGEIFAMDKGAAGLETHVIRVESIGQHDDLAPTGFGHERAIVIVGVGIVQKPAMLAEQPAGVDGGSGARVPAQRRGARGLGDRGHRARDGPPLGRLVHVDMTLPTPAMRGDLVPIRDGLLGDPGGIGQRPAVGVQRGRDAIVLQRLSDAGPAAPGAIFIMALHAEVTHALHPLGRFVDELVRLIAGGKREFRAFLDVHDDGDREPGVVRPADRRFTQPVAREIAVGWRQPRR